jgi:hypothetical protein
VLYVDEDVLNLLPSLCTVTCIFRADVNGISSTRSYASSSVFSCVCLLDAFSSAQSVALPCALPSSPISALLHSAATVNVCWAADDDSKDEDQDEAEGEDVLAAAAVAVLVSALLCLFSS